MLLPLAAGGFIYVGASDLIPELHQERGAIRSAVSFIVFVLSLILFSRIQSYLQENSKIKLWKLLAEKNILIF